LAAEPAICTTLLENCGANVDTMLPVLNAFLLSAERSSISDTDIDTDDYCGCHAVRRVASDSPSQAVAQNQRRRKQPKSHSCPIGQWCRLQALSHGIVHIHSYCFQSRSLSLSLSVCLLVSLSFVNIQLDIQEESAASLIFSADPPVAALIVLLLHAALVRNRNCLDFSACRIKTITSTAAKLFSQTQQSPTAVLDLRNNSIRVLPSEFVAIEKAKLSGNPLSLLPMQVRTKILRRNSAFGARAAASTNEGWNAAKKYCFSLHTQAASWNRCRAIFVGQEDVGKTTLVCCCNRERERENKKPHV
jgi:hypothetical protein